MDPGARESVVTYENGIGDVAITYENEYYAGVLSGADFEIVRPSSTILIENPIALVDTYADAHGTREVAQAFVDFVYTPEAQAIFAAHGFRPPLVKNGDAAVTPEPGGNPWGEGVLDLEKFPIPADLFTIDDVGGWPEVIATIFSDDGVYNQVIAEIQGG
jgi:sulfate transport system substrate-binding protein